jgi:hypothetical protein
VEEKIIHIWLQLLLRLRLLLLELVVLPLQLLFLVLLLQNTKLGKTSATGVVFAFCTKYC